MNEHEPRAPGARHAAHEEPPQPELPWLEAQTWRHVDCGPGWYALIRQLDAQLRTLVPEYRVAQCKQKFGGLRYYVDLPRDLPSDTYDAAYELIRRAEAESMRICEHCGQPGHTRYGRYVATLCDRCAADLNFDAEDLDDDDRPTERPGGPGSA